MFSSIKKSVLLLAVAAVIMANQVVANDQVSQQLLTEFWSTTKGKASTQYFAAQTDRTAESVYAFALVKTKQHDVKMALRAIEVLQKMEPKNGKPLRLKTWLQLRQDEVEAAMGSLIEYISLIDQDSRLSAFERKEAMEFAGRVLGFLDGPVAHKVNGGDRDAAVDQISARMTPEDGKAFEAGYTSVMNQFSGLMSEKVKVDADAAAEDAVVQQAKFASLAAKEKELHEAEQRTAKERERTRAQITKGLTDIARKDLTFANQPRVYGTYAVRSHYPLHHVTGGSASKSHMYKHGTGHKVVGYVARPWFRHAGYNDLYARRNILAGHYNELRDLGAGQMNSLSKELKEISKAKNRTMNQKLRALRPSGKIVTQSVALKSKARSIMTYEQFPLEIERQLLLAATK